MIHSNTGELNQLFSTFNRVWGAGRNASLNLKTVDGKVTALVGALLELQLGHLEDPRPGAKPEAEPVAAYQPHARHHRGPGRQARDNARRDAWRARRQETLPSPQATPPPPPPPPIEPLRRLITVVRNNRANNFSQLDGTTHHGVDNGEDTNRPPKPPYPEEPDGLEDTDNQEPETEDTSEEDNETDDSDHVYEEDDSRPLVVRFPKSWNATRRDHAYAVINAMRTVTYEVMYKDAQWEETWAKWLRMSNDPKFDWSCKDCGGWKCTRSQRDHRDHREITT